MNYEQRYEEALDRAKEQLNGAKVFDYDNEQIAHNIRTTVYNIFPEIFESEDEKIRKAIHIYLDWLDGRKDYAPKGEYSIRDMIAWLEKQGEQKSSWSKEDENSFLSALWCCKKAASIAKDENEMGTVWCAERWLKSLKDRYTWKPTEKQGEQKPFDYENANIQQKDFATVKTKFNKGDWIVNHYNHVACIESIDEKHYVLSCDDGSRERWSFMYIDRNWHLWTIEDAKEGDVLAGKIDGDSYILIYKQIKDGWIETYGHYYDSVDRFCVPTQLFCREVNGTFRPATKEQRDLLFTKMKEEGYEWNADKKELIKL